MKSTIAIGKFRGRSAANFMRTSKRFAAADEHFNRIRTLAYRRAEARRFMAKATTVAGPDVGGALGVPEAGVGDDVAAMTLDARGMIRYCNRATESLFKYRHSELTWQHVSLLLPELADLELIRNGELNPRLRFLFYTGKHFHLIAKDGTRFDGDLFINVLDNTGGGRLSLIVRPATSTS